MPAPLKWKTKTLLVKTETIYGTDSAPTGAANGILSTNGELKPMEGQDISRELEQAFLGGQPTIPVGLHAVLSFRVELAPSGIVGTAPAWGPLIRACSVAQTIVAATSVTYNPITDNPESVSIYMWIAGTRYVLLGARGTAVMRFTAQGIAYIEYTFTGLFTVPTEVARPTPVLTAFKKPQVVATVNTPVFTVDGVAMVMRNFALDLGNDVQTRFLVGSDSIIITDRADKITTQVEALPVSGAGGWNPYQKALDQAAVPVVLKHGLGAGNIAQLNVPAAQVQRPSGLENAQNIKEWNLGLTPLPVTGNDQWTLVLT